MHLPIVKYTVLKAHCVDLTAALVGYAIVPSVMPSFRIFTYQRLKLYIVTLHMLAGDGARGSAIG
jgi:uncharacterized MnhB-related membrane protein